MLMLIELQLRKLIRERIRQAYSKKFNMQEFERLASSTDEFSDYPGDIVQARHYAEERLQQIGDASSREALVLTSKTVLKIARSNRGVVQNKFEIEQFEKLKHLPITKIFKHDTDGGWLVSELVKPIKNEKQFKSITGFFEDEAYNAIEDEDNQNEFVKLLRKLEAAGLDPAEFCIAEQWGINADGELRLLDYGYGITHLRYR